MIRLATAWSEQRYKNACRRFATLVGAMPAELSGALRDAISRAPATTGADWRKARGTEVGAAAADDEQEGEVYDSAAESCDDPADDEDAEDRAA